MRIASLAALFAATATLTGCIVPELDNYPADKSKGSGTVVVGEDVVDSGGGGGGGGGGGSCTPGTYQGSLELDGTGNSASYTGQCTISGNVNVRVNATASEIDALQGIQTIYGALTIEAPTIAAHLSLPNLSLISNGLALNNTGNLQTLNLPALKSVSAIGVQSNATLVSLDATALTEPIQSIWLAENSALEAVSFGTQQITSALTIKNNPALRSAEFSGVTSIQSLQITNNATLQLLNFAQASLGIAAGWQICQNPALDTNWVATFKTLHPGGAICN